MATASAAFSPATVAAAAVLGTGGKCLRRPKIVYIGGLNAFNGLKAQNQVTSLGLPVSTEKAFAKIVCSLKQGKRRNGVLGAQCNAAAEIFSIAAIIPGLVLVGVAVGFVLLRLEATLEEE